MGFARWLQTYNARVFLQWSTISAGFVTLTAYHLPQSYLLDRYKAIVQSYSKGVETQLSPKVLQLYETVADDMKIIVRERPLIRLFEVAGFDMFHAGSTTLETGCIIGVPNNFNYEDVSDIDRRIKTGTKSIDWESRAGKNLARSLVLSEDARKFAIAREIRNTQSHLIWLQSCSPMTHMIIMYVIARELNERFKLRSHPARFIMYGLTAALAFTMHIATTDLTTLHLESDADEFTANISPEYAKGGVEFYTKLLERNKALRTLMGEEGEKSYTTSGNVYMFIRTRTVPLTERLRAVQEIANRNKETATETPVD